MTPPQRLPLAFAFVLVLTGTRVPAGWVAAPDLSAGDRTRPEGAAAPSAPLPTRAEKIARLKRSLDRQPGDYMLLIRIVTQHVLWADETEEPEAFRGARRYLSELRAEAPGAAEPLGWTGLLRCVEAKYGSGSRAKSLALHGLKELDTAIAMDPDNLKLRLMRASVGLKVPREWSRLAQAKDDLLRLELLIRRDRRRLGRFDLDAAEIYFKLGQAHLATAEIGEARRSWSVAMSESPASGYARAAGRQLARTRP
jgi:hypothetical protein